MSCGTRSSSVGLSCDAVSPTAATPSPFLLFREHIKNASNPQQYSMGNASLRGSASQDHPSDGSGDRGRSEHLRIKSNAPGFSHPAGRQRGTAAKDARKMEHAVGAADRTSGVLSLLRQDPPQGAGDDGVLSRFLQSVRLRVYFLLPFVHFSAILEAYQKTHGGGSSLLCRKIVRRRPPCVMKSKDTLPRGDLSAGRRRADGHGAWLHGLDEP